MPASLPNIIDTDTPSLRREFEKLGIEPYRVEQILDWVFKKRVYEFEKMSNLPKNLREKLAGHLDLRVEPVALKNQSENDASAKLLVRLADGQLVETVYIPKGVRRTVCVSSQVGCKFNCAFCASGQAGFFRNLSSSEIVSQVLRARDLSDKEGISNIVFMGIGEPFDNFDNVLRAVRFLNDPERLGIGARKITISTCGVVPKIRKLADQGMQIELSISLHGASDEIRQKIMPVNKAWPLAELLPACREYVDKTNREVTFEYILADGLNASQDDAKALVELLSGMRCKVNLIPLNPIPEFPYKRPTREHCLAFSNYLNDHGIHSTIRFSSGSDINAACGQLRSVALQGGIKIDD